MKSIKICHKSTKALKETPYGKSDRVTMSFCSLNVDIHKVTRSLLLMLHMRKRINSICSIILLSYQGTLKSLIYINSHA